MKKLEKQEAKLKVCSRLLVACAMLNNANQRPSSRSEHERIYTKVPSCWTSTRNKYGRHRYANGILLTTVVMQQTYEEMFMKINPLEAAAASKNKSKDIHLPSIDVNFGSNRILCVDLTYIFR